MRYRVTKPGFGCPKVMLRLDCGGASWGPNPKRAGLFCLTQAKKLARAHGGALESVAESGAAGRQQNAKRG